MKHASVIAFGDCSFADLPGEKSQIGIVIGYTAESNKRSVIESRYDQLLLESWESGSTKRVVRSTLAAETDAS